MREPALLHVSQGPVGRLDRSAPVTRAAACYLRQEGNRAPPYTLPGPTGTGTQVLALLVGRPSRLLGCPNRIGDGPPTFEHN